MWLREVKKNMATIGQRIVDERKRLGMTQEELAHRVGYKTKSAINKIEMGLREVPQKKIAAFASALGVTPGQLMGWDESPEELGSLAADVLLNPDLMRLAQIYMDLEQTDKDMLLMLAENMHQKTKKD
jgi:transcriptional regulator with XRE-family HTH domain